MNDNISEADFMEDIADYFEENMILRAADTIEFLSAKLQAANMERQ